MVIPKECPMCGDSSKWRVVDETKTGFSFGKAILGALFFGRNGLLFGALGKKAVVMCCGNCGFKHEYRK